MSFRNRLSLFFVLIVIVPMIVVALLGFRLISDSEKGKDDARLAQGQRAAIGLLREQVARSSQALARIGRDVELTSALRTGDTARAAARGRQLARSLHVARLRIAQGNRVVLDTGSRSAIAPARRALVSRSGRTIGTLQVSQTTASDFIARAGRVTGLDLAVARGGHLLGTSLTAATTPPRSGAGTATIQGTDYRYASFGAGSFGDGAIQVVALDKQATKETSSRRRLIVAILLGFLVLAFSFALGISRALSGQIARFLEAAKRLGGGDFSKRVPIEGDDEFSALGSEFNRMSDQLETKIGELERERGRLRASIQRTGAAVASSLDRDALLDIALSTAVDGVEAEAGRVSLRDKAGMPLEQRAAKGDVRRFHDVIREAEVSALASLETGSAKGPDREALAFPLRDSENSDRVLGIICVARAGRPFSEDQRELFKDLASQAAISIENVDLHDVVQRQAVTDELTGLFNHRRFQEVVSNEVERAKRFNQPLGLVMLDIDNFKQVNDTYGHQQGDLVLREVSRVLRESSREIDEPARYGGEELAVALPQTDLEGADLLAERVRQSIEALEVPRVDGEGTLKVTASLGVAALPANADTKADLIGAADAALYAAKRGGKNQTVRAPAAVAAE